jgi:hypothetical protein
MKDGSRFTDKEGWQTMQFVEQMADRDPRLAASTVTPGYIRLGATTVSAPDLSCSSTGYQLAKWVMDETLPQVNRVDMSYNDIPVYRIAEMYLIYAEAKAELGTLTQGDLDNTVNKLRARAGVTGNLQIGAAAEPWIKDCYPTLAAANPSNLGVILEIRRERTVELVMEGFRYWDIMRWKEGKVFEEEFLGMYIKGAGPLDVDGDGKADFNIATASNPGTPNAGITLKIGENLTLVEPSAGGSTYNGESGFLTVHRQDVMQRKWIEERDYLYPIPTKERVLTNGALKQNPGWDDKLGL